MKIFGRRAGVFDDPLGQIPELGPGEFMVFHSTTSRRFYDRYRVASV